MSNQPKVAKCPFCGRLYETYNMTIADQTCCPACRAEAARQMKNQGMQK